MARLSVSASNNLSQLAHRYRQATFTSFSAIHSSNGIWFLRKQRQFRWTSCNICLPTAHSKSFPVRKSSAGSDWRMPTAKEGSETACWGTVRGEGFGHCVFSPPQTFVSAFGERDSIELGMPSLPVDCLLYWPGRKREKRMDFFFKYTSSYRAEKKSNEYRKMEEWNKHTATDQQAEIYQPTLVTLLKNSIDYFPLNKELCVELW